MHFASFVALCVAMTSTLVSVAVLGQTATNAFSSCSTVIAIPGNANGVTSANCQVCANGAQQSLQGLSALFVEAFRKQTADKTLAALAHHARSGGVRLQDLATGRIDDQHRFGGDLEQQAMTRLRLAKF